MQKQSKNVDSSRATDAITATQTRKKGKGTVVNHPLDKKGESVNPSTYVMQHCCCGNSKNVSVCKPEIGQLMGLKSQNWTETSCQDSGNKNGKNQSLYQNKDADETEKIVYPINFMY